MASDSTGEANDSIHKANSKIDFQGQTFLGVLAQDPNGCYVGMFQKYKAETGAIVSQLNVFFMGSIKDRAVNFYLWGPHENDASVATMLTAERLVRFFNEPIDLGLVLNRREFGDLFVEELDTLVPAAILERGSPAVVQDQDFTIVAAGRVRLHPPVRAKAPEPRQVGRGLVVVRWHRRLVRYVLSMT